MKVRCPYCREVFEPTGRQICPQCNKTVLMPGFFGRRAAPDAIGRAGQNGRRSARGLGVFASPARMLIILVGMLLVGLLLVRRARTPAPPDGSHKQSVAASNVQTLRGALDKLLMDAGRYPATEEGPVSLVHNPGPTNWNGPYIFELKPDPWGRPFRYANEAGTPRLYSVGADGEAGTADDVLPPKPQPTGRGSYPAAIGDR